MTHALDRNGLSFPAAWITCPECGVGKGSDHLKSCSMFRRPAVKRYIDPRFHKKTVRRVASKKRARR